MSAHCSCDDPDPISKEVSPSHADVESWITECGNCWGLITA